MGHFTSQVCSSHTMKVLSLISFVLAVASADWTCDECDEMSAFMAFQGSDPAFILSWEDEIIADICPELGDPELCVNEMPYFWSAICPDLFAEFFSHICDDIEACQGTGVPTDALTDGPADGPTNGPTDGPTDAPTDNPTDTTMLRAFVPSCDSCQARMTMWVNDMSSRIWIEQMIDFLVTGNWCNTHYPNHNQDCKDAIEKVLPVLMPYIAAAPRDWVDSACQAWGCTF